MYQCTEYRKNVSSAIHSIYMNQKKFIITATIPILVLLLGIGVGQAKAWDEGCCFGGGHYWHHYWGFHHYWGCGGCESGGIGDFNSYQSQSQPPCCDNEQQPSVQSQESTQGSSVNVVNSPGAYVSVNQNQDQTQNPIAQVVHGLCGITGINCNPGYQGQVGYDPGYQRGP